MRLILQILVLSSNIKKGEIERTLFVNLVLMFDYNTWKYLTYSLVSTGNMQKGRNAVLSEMEQEGKDVQLAGRPPDRQIGRASCRERVYVLV